MTALDKKTEAEGVIQDAPKSSHDHIEAKTIDEKADLQNRDYAGAVAKTDPNEIRLVRKLDRRIMVGYGELTLSLYEYAANSILQPILCFMYFLNYVDRNTIAQARLNDMEDDLGMHGTQFNTTVSILFVGYVLTQVPSNMLITRVPPSIYMSAWMVVWSIVSGRIHFQCHNYAYYNSQFFR